ncbi:DUF3662 and FHA domain-containing protein [Williamsia sterculiae]|uniref:FHA domain-containing protein n=1 Tax=Williamsia sterculiae TaxID=1344003 RepID=A0A1N7FEK8_9NOCA|nr:DUF3662 and FHA domain-containing protein [Williamsia sterculiae]SIR98743.1 FHA domain-containing protein [Williamsia sterculiae]
MGILQRLERKLESAVDDGFARVFGGKVAPQEVENALQRSAEDSLESLGDGSRLASNSYTVVVSSTDYDEMAAEYELNRKAFSKHLENFIHDNGWQTYGDVVVELEQSPALHTGMFRAHGRVDPDARPIPVRGTNPTAHNNSNAEAGAVPMTHNSGYDQRRGYEGSDRGYDPGNYQPEGRGDQPQHGDDRGYDDHRGYDQGPDQRYQQGYDQQGGYDPRYSQQQYGDQQQYGRQDYAPHDYGRQPGYDQADHGDYGRGYEQPYQQGGYQPGYQQGGYDPRYAPQYEQGYAQGGGYGGQQGGYALAGYDQGYQQGYAGGNYAPTAVTLVLEDGSNRTFQLRDGSNVIGRGQDAQFRLPDTGVSRRHVEIRWDGHTALLSDLNSTNGTTVNEVQVSSWELADGDRIRVGHSDITVRFQ